MKIAFLVVAHSNFMHLRRLIDVLSSGGDDIFLHIDRRARSIPDLSACVNLHQIARQTVHWAGFSQVVVTNRLFAVAVANSGAEYFVLISGGDYPIRPLADLRRFLAGSRKEHINIRKGFTQFQTKEKLTKFHLEYTRRNPKLLSTKLARFIERQAQKHLPEKEVPFQIYTGHNWCALTRDAVDYLLDVSKETTKYDKFFKYTTSPDEAYHQTILGNSHFYERVAPYLTFTDWSGPEKPAYITEQHVELLKEQREFQTEFGVMRPFFARKFHDGSRNVVSLIDDKLLDL